MSKENKIDKSNSKVIQRQKDKMDILITILIFIVGFCMGGAFETYKSLKKLGINPFKQHKR